MRFDALAVCLVGLAAWPAVSGAVPIQWTGAGDGSSWGQAANWNPAAVPDNGTTTYEVSIGGSAAVTVNGSFRINSLSSASGVSLSIPENAFLGFNADSINDGTIRLQDDALAGNATLRFEGVVRLGGIGRVLFDSGNTNQIGPLSGGHVLTVGAGQTLATSGPGARGLISGLLVNEGTIDANGGRIELSNGDKTNLGLMRARNGGTLGLSGFALANLGGSIDLDATGTLELNARINEGTIGGPGRVVPALPGELQAVALSGVSVEIIDGRALDIFPGTLVNDGTIRLLDDPATTGLGSSLRTRDAVLIEGSGSVVFASNGANNSIAGFSGSTLALGANQTLTTTPGSFGAIGLPLSNAGTIDADGGTISLSGSAKTNTGLLRARSGGTLILSGFTLANSGAIVQLADLGSALLLNGARIEGGRIEGSGVLRPGLPGELRDVTLSGVTVEIRDGNALDVFGGTLVNDGTIRLLDDPATGGLGAFLRTRDAVRIEGSGSVVFASDGANNSVANFPGSTLALGANQTLTTTPGSFGAISLPLSNAGTIDANGGTISLSGSAKTNTGLLRARSGGTLDLSGFTLDNTGALISLASGGTLNLSGQIAGGSIQGAGVLRPGFPGELQGVSLSGVTVEIRDGNALDLLAGTLVNDGTIQLLDDPATGGLGAFLRTRDAVRIDGSGRVVFASNGASNAIGGFSGSTLALGANQTLTTTQGGVGAISVTLTNSGTIDADGGTLSLAGPLASDGLLQARNAGVLSVQTDVTGTGRWSASSGGILRIAAGRVAATSGDVVILADGELELLGPRMTGATFLFDVGAVLDVDGTLAASAGLDARISDSAGWQWGPAAGLEITNATGAPPGPWNGWAFVEVGGADQGPGGTFSNGNLWLPRLVVGPQGRVFLSDEIDNGRRGAGGEPEALYVGSLVFSDATGQLNLNGLNLYYQSLSGNPAQIIDVPVPPDRDRDGIENSLDNCPYFASADQADANANGIGNVCECGDQNEDGRVDVRDLVAINAAIFGSQPKSPLCDTNNDGLCNVIDIVGANAKIFGRPAFCSRYPLPAP